MKTLTITISPTGEATTDVAGVTGPACLALTKPIEDAIGSVTDRKKKPDFFKATTGPAQRVGH